ncbi:hypothetical protein, partial [Pseudomonas brassicae]|uniref:hypothetical protein n=1 Tax=Pseudomonas brassicae TaxID=2708063 RepID=UPI001FB4A544
STLRWHQKTWIETSNFSNSLRKPEDIVANQNQSDTTKEEQKEQNPKTLPCGQGVGAYKGRIVHKR